MSKTNSSIDVKGYLRSNGKYFKFENNEQKNDFCSLVFDMYGKIKSFKKSFELE